MAICISKNSNNGKTVTQNIIPEKWELLPKDLVIIFPPIMQALLFYQFPYSCLTGPKQLVFIKNNNKRRKRVKARKMLCTMSHSTGYLGNPVQSISLPGPPSCLQNEIKWRRLDQACIFQICFSGSQLCFHQNIYITLVIPLPQGVCRWTTAASLTWAGSTLTL